MTQKTALEILKSGENVFLTGAPGAGKTYVLNQYITYAREHDIAISVTASTGIAASHIGGMTLHSFCGLGLHDKIDDAFIKNLLQKKRKVVSRLKNVKVLIIDEISMVSPEVFASVDTIMQRVRLNTEPFGGVQVVLAGDFFQLPPVVRKQSLPSDFYEGGDDDEVIRYAWQSNAWRELAPAICYIQERHRHDDESFLTILDEIRSADIQEESLQLLRECYDRQLEVGKYARLYTHNADVDRINQEELKKLSTQAYRYPAVTTGREKIVESIFSSTLVVQDLILKEGATVIFIKNDPEGEYVNGTIGTIEKFDEVSKRPVVKTFNGKIIIVPSIEWTREDAGKVKVLAQVRQLPLRLAWAITVHKSQGMTLDSAEIDLSRSFEVGQGYVALSRVKNLAGLRLLGFNDVALRVDPTVGVYDEHLHATALTWEQKYGELSDSQKKEIHEDFIKKSDGSLQKQKNGKKNNSFREGTYGTTYTLVKKGLTVSEIAKKRDLAKSTVFKHIKALITKESVADFSTLKPKDDIMKVVKDAVKSIEQKGNGEDLLLDGSVRVRAIYEYLKEEVRYDDINLALIFIAVDEKV